MRKPWKVAADLRKPIGTAWVVFRQGTAWNAQAWHGFSVESSGTVLAMNNAEHAARLRKAIAAAGLDRATIATAVGRNVRTVTNWTSEKAPTQPTETQKVILRRILGPYDTPGDEVEIAVKGSELTEDRQYDVIGYYKKRLREQREEAVS